MNDNDEIAETVAWLRQQSAIQTNSLHCGDNSLTIQVAHRRAAKFDKAADIIESLKGECEAIVAAHL